MATPCLTICCGRRPAFARATICQGPASELCPARHLPSLPGWGPLVCSELGGGTSGSPPGGFVRETPSQHVLWAGALGQLCVTLSEVARIPERGESRWLLFPAETSLLVFPASSLTAWRAGPCSGLRLLLSRPHLRGCFSDHPVPTSRLPSSSPVCSSA